MRSTKYCLKHSPDSGARHTEATSEPAERTTAGGTLALRGGRTGPSQRVPERIDVLAICDQLAIRVHLRDTVHYTGANTASRLPVATSMS